MEAQQGDWGSDSEEEPEVPPDLDAIVQQTKDSAHAESSKKGYLRNIARFLNWLAEKERPMLDSAFGPPPFTTEGIKAVFARRDKVCKNT
jgi:hypothetical protein